MMVTEEFIAKMKAFMEVVDDALAETKEISDQIGQQEDRPAAEETEEKVDEGAEQEPSDNPVEEDNNEVPALVPQEDEESDDEAEESESEEESDDENEEESDYRVRRSNRIRAGIKRPDRYDVIPIKLNLKVKMILDAENPLSFRKAKSQGAKRLTSC
jgi:hypothetical protein